MKRLGTSDPKISEGMPQVDMDMLCAGGTKKPDVNLTLPFSGYGSCLFAVAVFVVSFGPDLKWKSG